MTTDNSICEKSFAVEHRYANFYTGGDLAWSADGTRLFCNNNTKEITAVEVATGELLRTYGLNDGAAELDMEEDVLYTFALAASNEHLVTAHRSGLLRLWSVETGKVLKLWKGLHKGPIVKLQFSACCQLICSSGADSTLRVWDFVNSTCVAVLREFPGPSQLVQFHATRSELYAVGSDQAIYCWNYNSKQLLQTLRGHLSQVTALSFEEGAADAEAERLATVGRDKVLIVWRVSDGKQLKVIPMFEELEGVLWLPGEQPLVASGNGTLRTVHSDSAKIAPYLQLSNCEVKLLLHCASAGQLAIVTTEQNILVYQLPQRPGDQLTCCKQLIGFNDEILDMCYLGDDDRFLAVATNSKNIKLYDTTGAMNCKILAGHTDTVITLSAVGKLLLSAGKDYSIRLWQLQLSDDGDDADAAAFDLTCIASNGSSHTSTIGCLAFAHSPKASLFSSVCQDGSMKVWQLKHDKTTAAYSFIVRYSALAHDKEINCVAFAPNDKMLATASQDKTAKLWSSETQTTLGTLRGHARGVWCVRFSPVDQIVLTSSGDCSVRIWSLGNLACLKRFEQECSILRAEFVEHGKFIITAGTDGLLKTWNIKTNACVQTLDEHTDRIWSLAVSSRSHKYFYSGGADSQIIRWHDNTKAQRNAQIDKRQAMLEQEQALSTLLHHGKQRGRAFALALTLDKPHTSYKILKQFVRENDETSLKRAIDELTGDQRSALVEHVKVWNTNTRHAQVANLVLQHILHDVIVRPAAAAGAQRQYNASNLVEVLTPYTQRHFKRLTETQKDLAFLDFIVQCM